MSRGVKQIAIVGTYIGPIEISHTFKLNSYA